IPCAGHKSGSPEQSGATTLAGTLHPLYRPRLKRKETRGTLGSLFRKQIYMPCEIQFPVSMRVSYGQNLALAHSGNRGSNCDQGTGRRINRGHFYLVTGMQEQEGATLVEEPVGRHHALERRTR